MVGLKSPQVIERRRVIVGMHRAGLGLTEIASALGLSKSAVHSHIIKHRAGKCPRRAISKSLVVKLLREGFSRAEIATKIGISRAYVTIILTQFGITAREAVEVPPWVPLDLRADYLDFARDFDEHYAAREVRRLKAEAA